jgi:ribosomal protein S18 acetylase RimI-like enzyme
VIEIRRLGPADADLARAAAMRFKGAAGDLGEWLASSRHLLLAALEGRSVVGWVYGYELPRIDRAEAMWLLYEIDVAEGHRRRGIGKALLGRFLEDADGPVWLLTNAGNEAAMRLYKDGARPNADDVLIRFRVD